MFSSRSRMSGPVRRMAGRSSRRLSGRIALRGHLQSRALAALALGIAVVRTMSTDATTAIPTFSRVTLVGGGQAIESGPAISPDGKWIAYLSNARGQTDVWVKFLSGGDPVNLTASTTLEIQSRTDLGGLAISPDGSLIAFDAGATKGTPANSFDAWVIPAPLGGTPRKVVELGRALRWSPDGTQIAFVRPGGSAGDALHVARSDGGSPQEDRRVARERCTSTGRRGRTTVATSTSTTPFSTANREPA